MEPVARVSTGESSSSIEAVLEVAPVDRLSTGQSSGGSGTEDGHAMTSGVEDGVVLKPGVLERIAENGDDHDNGDCAATPLLPILSHVGHANGVPVVPRQSTGLSSNKSGWADDEAESERCSIGHDGTKGEIGVPVRAESHESTTSVFSDKMSDALPQLAKSTRADDQRGGGTEGLGSQATPQSDSNNNTAVLDNAVQSGASEIAQGADDTGHDVIASQPSKRGASLKTMDVAADLALPTARFLVKYGTNPMEGLKTSEALARLEK